MSDHHFLSYSSVDGFDFALKLVDDLAVGPPSYDVWMDQRDLQPGVDRDVQTVEAIRECQALLLAMTTDGVDPYSDIKPEWTRALKYKKPIAPLRVEPEIELPFRLASRQYNDFSEDYEQGLAIGQEIGDRHNKANTLAYLGSAMLDQDQHTEAVERYDLARIIAAEIGNPETGSEACHGLALARLLATELEQAREANLEAQAYDYARNRADVQALTGVIALRQRSAEEARQALELSVSIADSSLEHSENLYRAWDAKGLAYCGLALCGDKERLEEAREAYQSARKLCSAPGVVGRVMRLFDALAEADDEGLLTDIRPVAAGEA